MKILFFGCQKIAVDILKLIQESTHDVVGVVTQDEERDRLFGDELVSEYCFRNGIPSFRAHEGSLSDCFDLFNSLSPDIIFSIYYRRILPNKIIGLSKLGGVNLHPGLLPRDRGPNPTYWNVRRGDRVAGTTLHYIDSGMDTGDIIAQKQTEVCGRTGFMLNRDIMELGVRLFKEQFEMIMSGRNDRMPQDNRMATCNTKFSNNLRYIDWCQPAESIINHVRAHAPPYACSLTTKKEKVIRIEEAVKYGGERNSKGPGSYKRVGGLEYIVQTHTTPVKIVANVDDCPLITKGRFNSGVPE